MHSVQMNHRNLGDNFLISLTVEVEEGDESFGNRIKVGEGEMLFAFRGNGRGRGRSRGYNGRESRRGGRMGQDRRQWKCTYCNKQGHTVEYCRDVQARRRQNQNANFVDQLPAIQPTTHMQQMLSNMHVTNPIHQDDHTNNDVTFLSDVINDYNVHCIASASSLPPPYGYIEDFACLDAHCYAKA